MICRNPKNKDRTDHLNIKNLKQCSKSNTSDIDQIQRSSQINLITTSNNTISQQSRVNNESSSTCSISECTQRTGCGNLNPKILGLIPACGSEFCTPLTPIKPVTLSPGTCTLE